MILRNSKCSKKNSVWKENRIICRSTYFKVYSNKNGPKKFVTTGGFQGDGCLLRNGDAAAVCTRGTGLRGTVLRGTGLKMISCSGKKTSSSVLRPHAAVGVSHQILGASKMLLLHFLLPKSHSHTCSPGGGTVNTVVKKEYCHLARMFIGIYLMTPLK